MRANIKKTISAMLIVTFAFVVMMPAAFAAMPRGPAGTYSWSVGAGGSEWHGYNKGSTWELEEKEATWWISITSPSDRAIRSDLRYYVPILPDPTILSHNFTGSNGDSRPTQDEVNAGEGIFQPAANRSYFAVVSTTDSRGAAGKTTINYRNV